MKHIIIIKFAPEVARSAKLFQDIENSLEKCEKIKGVHDVRMYPNIIRNVDNYDLMIEVELEKKALILFEVSMPYQLFLNKFGRYIVDFVVLDRE